MEVINDLSKVNLISSVVCVGNFDGLHRGHRVVIERTVFHAKQMNADSVVFSFWPHPQKVLKPDSTLEYLSTYQEKVALFEAIGVDKLILFPFNREFASLSSQSFIEDYLVGKLKMKCFVIGYDHQYGKDREGNYHKLLEQAQQLDFEVERIEQKAFSGENISSSKIRKFIKSGQIDLANKLLSYHFFLIGKVEQGRQLGRKISFPTANIIYPDEKIIPKKGVYFVEVEIKAKTYFGVANLGSKPTIDKHLPISLEVHIFNFEEDIYGQNIKVSFLQFLREEMKFDNLESLKLQIEKDTQKARDFFNI